MSTRCTYSLTLKQKKKPDKKNIPIDASEGESTLSHSQGEEVQIVMFELRLQHGSRPHISAVFHVPLVKQRQEQAEGGDHTSTCCCRERAVNQVAMTTSA